MGLFDELKKAAESAVFVAAVVGEELADAAKEKMTQAKAAAKELAGEDGEVLKKKAGQVMDDALVVAGEAYKTVRAEFEAATKAPEAPKAETKPVETVKKKQAKGKKPSSDK